MSTLSAPVRQDGIDWLGIVPLTLVTFVAYVGGRIALQAWFGIPLLWGGDADAERYAQVLVILFVAATIAGYVWGPRTRRLCLEVTERGPVGAAFGTVVAVLACVVGLAAMGLLVRRLGGLAAVLQLQAAWASQIKELGLGPYYGLSYLLVIGSLVLAMRALSKDSPVRALAWYALAASPSVILGRRIIILFAGLPLLAVVQYHRRRLRFRHMAAVSAVVLVAFVLILLIRLQANGAIVETIGTSYEFSIYDALVAAVDRHRELLDFGPAYFTRHPGDFWGANTGALFLQRMAGYQFEGGATPPTAVGALWTYFGIPGLVLGGIAGGSLFRRIREGATAHPVCALLYGFALFYWFDFLRNGDIVLGIKLFIRYLAVLLMIILSFYRMRVTDNIASPIDVPVT